MDFLTFARDDLCRWVLGEAAVGAQGEAHALIDDGFRALLRQGLARYDAHRFNQMPLWRRVSDGRGSVIAPIWAAASRRIRSEAGIPLRGDAHADDVLERWARVRTHWPEALRAEVDAAPQPLRELLQELPDLLVAHAMISLSGLAIPDAPEEHLMAQAAGGVRDALPHSLQEDERLLGGVLRRALWAATVLGGLGEGRSPTLPPVPGDGASPAEIALALRRALQALLHARRADELDAERIALQLLEPCLRRLDLGPQADAAAAHAIAAAARAADSRDAGRWLDRLSHLAEARGDAEEALRLQRLRAGTVREVVERGDALRRAAQLAIEVENHGAALALLRDEASLQDAEGNVRVAGLAWLNLAKLFHNLESDVDAQASAEEARRRLQEAGTLGLARQALTIRAEALIRLGRKAEAIACLEEAVGLAQREEDHEVEDALRHRLTALLSE